MTSPTTATWVTTTQTSAFVPHEPLSSSPFAGQMDVVVRLDRPQQRVEGFGGCFNELGWDALQLLDDAGRNAVLRDFFAPGEGLGLTLCRMPVGANDFSRDWYSYDETPGDLTLADFSAARDTETLIPFIHAAQAYQPDLRLWASPWSPPTWMKTNGHYAAALPWPGSGVENGIRPDQVGAEGTDMFRLDDAHLTAYADYFARFVEAYRAEGIGVEMVMPQNEFNSAQVFPSCTWTPEGLARFVAVLGPRLDPLGTSVFLGTVERANPGLVEAVLADPAAAPWVRGVGFQWAGRGAVEVVHAAHPDLPLYQTEQECGDGRNDWRFARHAWKIVREFFSHGATAYTYWNLALTTGGVSRWGWAQNSLVVVDPQTRALSYTYDYQVLKHVAHFVRPGARRLEASTWSGHENQLAFRNEDGSVVIVVQNDLSEELTIRYVVGDQVFAPTLPADSFSTIVIPG